VSRKHRRERQKAEYQEGQRQQQRRQQREAVLPSIDADLGLVDILMPIFGEWNFAEKALDCLPQAAAGLNEGYRVIVVDNGTPAWKDAQGNEVSPEAQAIAVRERLRPNDVFFRLDPNQGYPAAVNACAARGRAPLILVLTADVYLFPGALANMVRALDNPAYGVVGPLLIFPEGTQAGPPGRVQHAGISIDIRGGAYHQFIGWTPDNPRVTKPVAVAAVTGACFLTRRSLWRHLGGFATVYGKGTFEDMEYCFAARQTGAKVLYLPTARGYHVVGGSFQAGASKGTGGFNLALNETIFKGRWAHMLAWDDWRRW